MQQFVRRVLMAFVIFVAVTSPSRVHAATIVQDQKFGSLLAAIGFNTETHKYLLFDPSLGTLTNVELVMTSQIVEPIGSFVTATAEAFPVILDGFTVAPTTNFDFSATKLAAPFIGIGIFPATFDYFASCPGGCGGTGWFGNLQLIYTYDPPGDAVTPLPAALPLFATGLGALGLLGWRRKRKQAA